MEKSQDLGESEAAASKPASASASPRLVRTPKIDKYGMARCGFCHTCQNPQLKKACITNKNKRKLEGWEPPAPAAKLKVHRSGERKFKITGLSGVGTIVIRQPALGDFPLTPKPKADAAEGNHNNDVDQENIEGPKKKRRKWQRKWVFVPNLLQNGYCRLLKWVDDETYDETYDEVAVLEELQQKSSKIEFIPDPSAIAKSTPTKSPNPHATTGTNIATTSSPNTPTAGAPLEKQQNHHVHLIKQENDLNALDAKGGGGKKVEVTAEAWTPVVSPSKKKPSLKNNVSLKALYPGALMCSHAGCEKFFVDSNALRKHMRTHAEKEFLCSFPGCGKRFGDSSKLKRHFLIHTGEKRFVCPFKGCGKACSLDFNLRSHIRSMHKEEIRANPEILKMKLFPSPGSISPATPTATATVATAASGGGEGGGGSPGPASS